MSGANGLFWFDSPTIGITERNEGNPANSTRKAPFRGLF